MQARGTLRRVAACAAVLGAAMTTDAPAAWPGVNGRLSLTQRVEPPLASRANRDILAYARQALDAPVDRVRLTTSTSNEEQPAWSPDGRTVAFKRLDRGFEQVVLLDATTAPYAERQLTFTAAGAFNNTQPSWSPDGSTILVRTNRANPSVNVGDIWAVDVAGSDPARPVVERPGDERYPSYSPDGRRLLFRGDTDGRDGTGDEELFVLDLQSAGVTQLTDNGFIDTSPAWSPDGTQVAFNSNRDGDAEIHVMDADGTNVRQLTFNDAADPFPHDEGPAWSPDGRLIAYTRAVSPAFNANADSWVMNADGSGQQPYTPPTPIVEESPDWQALPVTAGDPAEPWVACGDLSLAPGGVASILVRKAKCEHAIEVAERWERMTETPDAPPEDLKGFVCTAERHTFDQVLVQCAHDGRRKAVAFVYREE
jgi:Tol biopolymer transport system component